MADHIINTDLYKELYYKEIEVKYHVDEQLKHVTQIVVVVSGAFFFLAQNLLSNAHDSSLKGLLFVCVTIAGGLILRGIYYHALASINTSLNSYYKGIPTALQMLEEQKTIYARVKRDLKDLKPSEVREYVELEFDKKMVTVYADSADHNQKINDTRLENVYRAKVSMIHSFIAISILATVAILIQMI